jgi:hypothetical protein
MIGGAVAVGIPFSWVTADEAYSGNPKLRAWLLGTPSAQL